MSEYCVHILRKMKGEENAWRRRIGAYRIFYEICAKEKIVISTASSGEVQRHTKV